VEVVAAGRVVVPYVLEVTFGDGERRRVDVAPLLGTRLFAPPRDRACFARVAVDPELGTVGWPNGADRAPAFLSWGPEGPPPGDYRPVIDANDPVSPASGSRSGTGQPDRVALRRGSTT